MYLKMIRKIISLKFHHNSILMILDSHNRQRNKNHFMWDKCIEIEFQFFYSFENRLTPFYINQIRLLKLHVKATTMYIKLEGISFFLSAWIFFLDQQQSQIALNNDVWVIRIVLHTVRQYKSFITAPHDLSFLPKKM